MQISKRFIIFFQLFIPLVLILAPVSHVFAQKDNIQKNIYAFTAADRAFLKTFSLSSLPPLPDSPSNEHADSLDVARLGKALFFDKRLSKASRFSCASCHKPEKYFTDGLALGVAHGIARRSTPTLLGAAWSPWQYWDGRKDSLWSQALGPIEHTDEMGLDRASFVRTLLKYHGDDYEALFGKEQSIKQWRKLSRNASPLGTIKEVKRWKKMTHESRQRVNRVFVNAGKSLMAYQRRLHLSPSRFDVFIDTLAQAEDLELNQSKLSSIFNSSEVRGMRLFMGKANCASCHNGPLFTNFEFHNIGAPEPSKTTVDLGRYAGVQELVNDEFTCLSQWSDAGPDHCEEMRFLKRTGPELVGAFKTPTLRNISQTGPYMQAGQFNSLLDVLNHYNLPKPPFYDREKHPNRPHFDILPLKLTQEEIADIIEFLKTLTSPYPNDDFWWNEGIR